MTPQWDQDWWEQWLRENAERLYGPARREAIADELARMAKALARLSAEQRDLAALPLDTTGVDG
ncbi:hypothetical protein [Thermorudis peleae]|uniref:hypothetical protein n=1 Tax=Thermorudis peleae TaxID=1382356 RepID=UPI00057146C9|nr:hypothetical protein [Thermorudis peleae]MBX6753102.1 hypothetical protein [Thermorudis peleae]